MLLVLLPSMILLLLVQLHDKYRIIQYIAFVFQRRGCCAHPQLEKTRSAISYRKHCETRTHVARLFLEHSYYYHVRQRFAAAGQPLSLFEATKAGRFMDLRSGADVI
jgi:hypothetical protein